MKLRERRLNPDYEQCMFIENLEQPLLPVEGTTPARAPSTPDALPMSFCTYEREASNGGHVEKCASMHMNTASDTYPGLPGLNEAAASTRVHPFQNSSEHINTESGISSGHPGLSERDGVTEPQDQRKMEHSTTVSEVSSKYSHHSTNSTAPAGATRNKHDSLTIRTQKKPEKAVVEGLGRKKYKNRRQYRNKKRRERRAYRKFCEGVQAQTYGYYGSG